MLLRLFAKKKMVQFTSRSFRDHYKSVFLKVIIYLFLGEISTQVSAAVNRCDYNKNVTYWTYCQECSIIQHYSCQSSYIQTSGKHGIRSCVLNLYFGGGFGSVAVTGCQHTCVKEETFKKCCDGFWGSECDGMHILKNVIYLVLIWHK